MPIVNSLPYNIQDGTAVDAVPVMANYNQILNDVNNNAAPIANPAFTGVPTAPTAAQGVSTTQIATTNFVTVGLAAVEAGAVTEAAITAALGYTPDNPARLTAYEGAVVASTGAGLVGLDVSLTYPLATLGDAAIDTISPRNKPYNAVADGVTDDSAALNAALSSGKKVIDGGGRTYKIGSQVTVPVGIQFRNAILQMIDANFVGLAYSTDSEIYNVKVLGTSRTNQYPSAQRGIADAITTNTISGGAYTGGSTNVTLDVRAENCNVNIDCNGTTDSFIKAISKNASGQAGVSEGYGILLYQGASRNQVSIDASGCNRHSVYVSSGSSNNIIFVSSSGAKTGQAVQINSSKDQPPAVGNVITGSDYGSYAGVAFVVQTTANPDIGGGIQANICKDFVVTGLAAASGNYVANGQSAFLMTMAGEGSVPSSGNMFLGCSARGAFLSTTLGVMHLALGTDSVVENFNMRATCANTLQGAFVLDSCHGYTRTRGINLNLLGSSSGIVAAWFDNMASGSYFSFDDTTIVSAGATKITLAGGTTYANMRGQRNLLVDAFAIASVPSKSAVAFTYNLPPYVQTQPRMQVSISSEGVGNSAQTSAVIISYSAGVVSGIVYNGYTATQGVTVEINVVGLPG